MPAKQSDDIFDEHDETKSSLQNNHSEDEACLKSSEVLQTTAPSVEDEANNQHVNGYSLETLTNGLFCLIFNYFGFKQLLLFSFFLEVLRRTVNYIK